MLEKYVGKYVKLLVSSNSGAGSGSEARNFNSMIVVFGTIKDMDDKFLELENSTTLYYPGVTTSIKEMFNTTISNVREPDAYENKHSLININNIIEVAVVE